MATQTTSPMAPEWTNYDIEFNVLEPREVGEGVYEVAITGKVFEKGEKKKKGAMVPNQRLEVYCEGELEQACTQAPYVKTDRRGNFRYAFENIPQGGPRGTGKMQIEVRIFGSPISEVHTATIPKKEKPKAKTLEAHAGDGVEEDGKVKYVVTLTAKNQYDKTIDAGQASWTCGPETGTANLSTGFTTLTVELKNKGEFKFVAVATKVNLTSSPITLKGPEKKLDNLTLKIMPPHFANDDGSFTVTVESWDGDNLRSNVEFTATCSETILRAFSLDRRRLLNEGNTLTLRTGASGKLTFVLYINDPFSATMIFGLQNGFTHEQMFTKI